MQHPCLVKLRLILVEMAFFLIGCFIGKISVSSYEERETNDFLFFFFFGDYHYV